MCFIAVGELPSNPPMERAVEFTPNNTVGPGESSPPLAAEFLLRFLEAYGSETSSQTRFPPLGETSPPCLFLLLAFGWLINGNLPCWIRLEITKTCTLMYHHMHTSNVARLHASLRADLLAHSLTCILAHWHPNMRLRLRTSLAYLHTCTPVASLHACNTYYHIYACVLLYLLEKFASESQCVFI